MPNKNTSMASWLSKLRDLESDSEEEPILIPSQAGPVLMPKYGDTVPQILEGQGQEQCQEPALREWNQTGVPKTLPYHKNSPMQAQAPRWNPRKDEWTSITKPTITPPHELATETNEITYTNTIDHASMWSDRVVSAFEKASLPKSELSEDFKENLGKLSFFRRPLIPKQ
jgi:hypothetical protein